MYEILWEEVYAIFMLVLLSQGHFDGDVEIDARVGDRVGRIDEPQVSSGGARLSWRRADYSWP